MKNISGQYEENAARKLPIVVAYAYFYEIKKAFNHKNQIHTNRGNE